MSTVDRISFTRGWAVLRASFVVGTLVGCSPSAPDAILTDAAVAEEAAPSSMADCRAACRSYGDCIGGSTYDVDACTTRCVAYASDATTRQRAATCRACVAGGSCASSVFMCAGDCQGIPF